VLTCYISRHGHAFIERALYLPKAWMDDSVRMSAAHVLEEIGFATKPTLAATMIERTLAAKVPFGWMAADTVNAVGAIETVLRRADKGYMLRGQFRPQRPVLGQGAGHCQQCWSGRAKPGAVGVAAPIGGRRHQARAAI
jgi:SRSO17 transposase